VAVARAAAVERMPGAEMKAGTLAWARAGKAAWAMAGVLARAWTALAPGACGAKAMMDGAEMMDGVLQAEEANLDLAQAKEAKRPGAAEMAGARETGVAQLLGVEVARMPGVE